MHILDDVDQSKELEQDRPLAQRRLLALESTRQLVESALAHELKTPAICIQGISEFLLQARGIELPPLVHEGLRIIGEQAGLELHLLDDLLQLARIQEGDLAPDVEPLPLVMYVEEVSKQLHARLASKSARLQLEATASLPLACGDPRLIMRLLSILCADALHHCAPDGLVTVRLTEAPDDQVGVEVATQVASGAAGKSAAREEAAADAVLRMGDYVLALPRRVGDLGLSLARAVAELHGCKLEALAHASGERGFRFFLPAVDT